jgi:hypothetical protein
MNDTFLFAIILSFVVGYTASKTLKHKCGYNLIEGTVNSGPCSASEELIKYISTSDYNSNAWRNECKGYKNKSDCIKGTVADYIPNYIKIDPHKCIWKPN